MGNPFMDTEILTWYILLGSFVLGVTNLLLAWRGHRKIRASSPLESLALRRSMFDMALFFNALTVMGFWLGYLLAASAVMSAPFLPISHGIFAGVLILLYWILAAITRVPLPSRKGIYGFLFATIVSAFVAIGLAYALLALLPVDTLAQVFGPSNPLTPFTIMLIYIDFLFVFPSDYFLLLFVLYTAALFLGIVTTLLLRYLVGGGAHLYSRVRNKVPIKSDQQMKTEEIPHV